MRIPDWGTFNRMLASPQDHAPKVMRNSIKTDQLTQTIKDRQTWQLKAMDWILGQRTFMENW
jgi:hypothetical protein